MFSVRYELNFKLSLQSSKTDNALNRNTEVRSCKYSCSGKAAGTIYSECMSVALVIQHAMQMCHIIVCGLSGSTIFFYIIS